ncbi:uncharacterized protein C19orf47 homolog [Contarinia nasturtii]|uniref:uncharacterized protein C19orf47 homolog n=1 Tax=Contarinia nasturtii TaxID=265458 RepID=UPI0012D390CA|nr:uncharacterized protein C19orf47 homolog [Contarinia nasturtii]
MVASANSWVKFFQSAGVPSAAAATYAHIFYENRMDLDMLTDLNKEYLREMGITPMGDIISILRHAKKVNEQTTRDKILSAEKQTITTASVTPLIASSVSKQSIKVDGKGKSDDEPSRKPARRVLPEHEGRYKITLPSGSTERSKEILAKQAMLYSDQEQKKVGIFDRLEQTKKVSVQPQIKITGLNNVASTSSSIFSRLGGKSDDIDMDDERAVAFAGILKSAPKKIVSIKKSARDQQKAILVRRIPAKAATMVADEYDAERMETGEKSVKFSSIDEILEIESRKKIVPRRIQLAKGQSIRTRLGLMIKNDKLILRKKKIVKLKQPVNRANGQIDISRSKMRSDELKKSVKSRLSMKNGPEVSKLVNRIGRVSLGSRLGTTLKNGHQNPIKTASASSVFDRLGFNKK